MMMVELRASEQQKYIPSDDMVGATLPTVPVIQQDSKARRIWNPKI